MSGVLGVLMGGGKGGKRCRGKGKRKKKDRPPMRLHFLDAAWGGGGGGALGERRERGAKFV